jgi:hypothetical protein
LLKIIKVNRLALLDIGSLLIILRRIVEFGIAVITPSFKDEGFLATEVEYAIQEKRKKGDKFAIISLQFVDPDGQTGDIPELLETYVWKKPKTTLEALREIVRALPISSGTVDWRPGISGVANLSTSKSTVTELCEEAKTILLAAVAGDGMVVYQSSLNSELIGAGDRSLIPDDSPRTIAIWRGGLEDLRRRRYIKDVGHKGEIFQVTREGYEAAAQLSEAESNFKEA